MSSLKKEFQELAKRAEAAGWSQADIARHLRISPSHVSGILKGPKEPSEPLIELFHLLIVDLPQTTEPPKAQGAYRIKATISSGDEDLDVLLANMPEPDREEFLTHAKWVAHLVIAKSQRDKGKS